MLYRQTLHIHKVDHFSNDYLTQFNTHDMINMISMNSMNTIKKGDNIMPEIIKGKYMFGSVKVGERGQIVIPKEARDNFDINPGDEMLVFGDEKKGLAIVKMDLMKGLALKILDGTFDKAEEENEESE